MSDFDKVSRAADLVKAVAEMHPNWIRIEVTKVNGVLKLSVESNDSVTIPNPHADSAKIEGDSK